MGTIRIPLHSRKYPNLYTLIDEEDYELVSQYRWHPKARKGGGFYVGRGKGSVRMHRVIMDATEGKEVDHINGDGLDNRRCNLRLASKSENLRNVGLRSDSSSPFKGVTFNVRGVWQSSIQIGGRRVYLGSFANPEDAAYAYDKAAFDLHGEFAKTNVSLGLLPPDFVGGPPFRKRKTSRFRGVKQSATPLKWTAQIYANGREVYLGTFESEDAAAAAYNDAAVRLHGDKAKINDAAFGTEGSDDDH